MNNQSISQLTAGGIANDTSAMTPPPGWGASPVSEVGSRIAQALQENSVTESSANVPTETPGAPLAAVGEVESVTSTEDIKQAITNILEKPEEEIPVGSTEPGKSMYANDLALDHGLDEEPTSIYDLVDTIENETVGTAEEKEVVESILASAKSLENKDLTPEEKAIKGNAERSVQKMMTELKNPEAKSSKKIKPNKREQPITLTSVQTDKEKLNPLNIEKSKKVAHFRSFRADAGIADRSKPVQVKGIVSRSLATVLNTFFKGVKENKCAVDDHITFAGTYLYKTKATGIWEEGGATSDQGSVVIATDPDGHAMVPVQVIRDKDVVNGRHARLPIWPGCYVILGGYRYGANILLIYKVTKVLPQIDTQQHYPMMDLALVAYETADEFTVLDGSGFAWTKEHPAVAAARARMYEYHAVTPAYVCDYKEFSLDSTTITDLNDALEDPDFLSRITEVPTLTDAYANAAVRLGSRIPELTRSECAQLVVYPVAYPDSIVVWVLGLVYDRDTKTSSGKRYLYQKVVIKESSEDQFFYPDRDVTETVDYDTMCKTLNAHGGSMINAFRRVTEYVDADLNI